MYLFNDEDAGDASTITPSSDNESCVEKEVITSDEDSDIQITHVVQGQQLSSSAPSVSPTSAAPANHLLLSLS